MCSFFSFFVVLLKTRNFCIIMCNVQVSIYVCSMCGNKDINRRIILTLNRIMCGNICVLLFSLFFVLLKTRNFCIIMCKNSKLDRVIPKGNRKINFLTPYVPFLSFIMVRFKYLTKKKHVILVRFFERINHLLLLLLLLFYT